jgi:hypothetical protein
MQSNHQICVPGNEILGNQDVHQIQALQVGFESHLKLVQASQEVAMANKEELARQQTDMNEMKAMGTQVCAIST